MATKGEETVKEPLSGAVTRGLKRRMTKASVTVDKELKMPDAYAALRNKLAIGEQAGSSTNWSQLHSKEPDLGTGLKKTSSLQ